jgi:hypothetical protein
MDMVAVQLPESLVKRLEEEGVPVNEAMAEALGEWLAKRRASSLPPASERQRIMKAIAKTGLLPSPEEQHAFFEGIVKTLGLEEHKLISHDELRQQLQGVTLSDLIVAERDERS